MFLCCFEQECSSVRNSFPDQNQFNLEGKRTFCLLFSFLAKKKIKVNFKRNISKMKTKLTYLESVQLWVSLVTCPKVNLSCGIAILHQHREIKATSENI